MAAKIGNTMKRLDDQNRIKSPGNVVNLRR